MAAGGDTNTSANADDDWGFAVGEEDIGKLAKTQKRQSLSGPYSPVQIMFHGLNRSGSMRWVYRLVCVFSVSISY